jgi:hypothetical protein
MSWTTPADLRAQVDKLWDKGRLLACLVDAGELFPLRLRLEAPSSAELSERFDEVRAWAGALQAGAGSAKRRGYRVVLREVRHRVIGANRVPSEVWIDALDDAIELIGKRGEARRFAEMVERTRAAQPALLPWLQQRALRALELADAWPLLLDVVAWMAAHPRPGVYLRQVDVPGVHSKFIEQHRAVLAELLDLCLSTDAIDARFSGAAGFAPRYGFRDKPLRVRFRLLDPSQGWPAAGADQDITLSLEAFSQLNPAASRVFITENEINYLAFPNVSDSLLIFGAGYGLPMLARADWLHAKAIHYWGDIDTHGFAILDPLRAIFPRTESFLMDRATLLEHEPLWIDEPEPTQRDLPRLTPQERALYDDLRWKSVGGERQVRLEQERIGFGWVERALERVSRAGEPEINQEDS